jgi:hypothetical protein
MIAIVRNILPAGTKISDLEALKNAVDDFCENNEREVVATRATRAGGAGMGAEDGA